MGEMSEGEEKVRARDKILRDPKAKDIALEIRKKYAFLGYEYRRSDF